MPVTGKRVAVALEKDFEDSEHTGPVKRLVDEGVEVVIIGVEAGRKLKGKRGRTNVVTDVAFSSVSPEEFDALLIPGGYSPDRLRLSKEAVEFVRRFVDSGKPVATICHGPQLLISANAVRDKTLTAWPSIWVDLENAGAKVVDKEVVVDGNLITSRKPSDVPAFNEVLIRTLEQGREAAA